MQFDITTLNFTCTVVIPKGMIVGLRRRRAALPPFIAFVFVALCDLRPKRRQFTSSKVQRQVRFQKGG
jgi:hypothetical protein